MSSSNRIPELDKLFEEVGTYRKGEDFKELLNFVKMFPQMAPYNAMLVHVQKPGSRFVTTAYEWKAHYERTPKAGARPLVILRPFGPVTFVFELNDTEGKPFPEALMEPFAAAGEISEHKLNQFIKSMQYEGIVTVEQDYGSSLAGYVQPIHETRQFNTQHKTVDYHVLFGIVMNRNLEPTSKIATLFHELGHVFCGHVRHSEAKWLPERYRLSIVEREFEAESVCWLLCERLGIKNPSAEYLSGYLNENGEIPLISIDTVLKAVGAIEGILGGKPAPRKELIAKN